MRENCNGSYGNKHHRNIFHFDFKGSFAFLLRLLASSKANAYIFTAATGNLIPFFLESENKLTSEYYDPKALYLASWYTIFLCR